MEYMGLSVSFCAGRPIVSLLFRLLRRASAAFRDGSIPADRGCPSRSTRGRNAVKIVLAAAIAVTVLYPAHAQDTIPHSCEHEGEQYRQPGDTYTTTYARCPAVVIDDGGVRHQPPVRACKVGGIPQYRNARLCTPRYEGDPNCNCKDEHGNVVDCYSPCTIVDGPDDTDRGNVDGGSVDGGDTSGGNTSGGNTSGGDTSGGDTSGGNSSGGNSSGGNSSGGNSSGGNSSGGGSGGERADNLELSLDDVTVNEDAGEAHFTVSIGTTTASKISVEYRTVDGTALAGLDYTETTGRLTLPPRAKEGTIVVPILDDEIFEADESFTVVLDRAVGAEIADGEATGTIVDDEPVPSLTVDDVSVTEDGGEARFTVSLDTESTEAVTVDYATADGTAVAGSDYTSTSGTLTIAAGSLSGTITVPVLDDALVELDETFRLTLSNASNASISEDEGTGTITDDDMATLSIEDVAVAEDGGLASFTVTLDQSAPKAVTVEYATADGTAAAGSDYESTSGSLVITAGSLSGTIVVPILDDAVPELAETFLITLSDAVNATISDDEATGTIADNDTPHLSIDDVTVEEDAGFADFTVMLDQAGMDPVTVEYATADGTAVAGSDYTLTSGTLTIAAGSLSGTVVVPVLDDALDELDETFRLTLSNAANASISEDEGTGTITDDDMATLSIEDVTVAEDGGPASFTVTLDQAAPEAVTVDYATSDGTAVAGSDYTSTSGTLTIAAGSLSSTIAVQIVDDILHEQSETFTLALTSGVNVNISDGQGTGTILDDDTPPVVGVVGVAKEALDTRITDAAKVRSVFRIYVVNLGDGEAARLQVSDDLSSAFPAPAVASVVEGPRVTGAPLSLNSAFDGIDDTGLLTGTDSLAAGASATVEFTVEVSLNGEAGPFENQALARFDDGNGNAGEDLSDNGRNPDPDGDGDPGGPGEDDPTPVEFPAALIGTVFADLDVDRAQDANEAGLGGWRVEVATTAGEIVASATSGATGAYAFPGVDPGDMLVRFRHPESAAVWGQEPVSFVLHSLTRLDYGAVPGGRVYDSVSRDVVPNVILALTDGAGMRLPNACLLDGQQLQRTASDGAYRFDLVHGAHTDCPTTSTTYGVEVVEAPDDYLLPPSSLIPPASAPLAVGTCPPDADPEAPCVVFPEASPPAAPTLAGYYLDWVVAAGDGTVVHNHVPLDPLGSVMRDGLVSVSKRATVRTAAVGDLVGYNVQVANAGPISLKRLELVDDLPVGFAFVPDSASLQEPGPDGTLGTGDDVNTRLEATGTDPITFGSTDLPAGKAISVRYMTRVTTGAAPGQHVNTVRPFVLGRLVGNEASASVEVTSDPIFEKTTVIGKVFDDRDGDGSQDPGEEGIPGVRLVSVSGLIVETDAHGRYHLADVDVGDAARGRNFILKLDPRTLARGAVVTSENPRVIRLTQALMSKVNFAVKRPAPGQQVIGEESSKLRREVRSHHLERIEPVRFESGKSNILPTYLDRLRSLLARYHGKRNLRVRFSGHTDDQPLGPAVRAIYADNQGLSEARAREVAKFVADELGLPGDMIETEGHAERMPVASNRTLAGMAMNRRVETELIYDDYSEEEHPVDSPPPTPETTEEVRFTEERIRLEPARFASGNVRLSSSEAARIDREFEALAGFEVIGASVVGHADAVAVSNVNRPSNETLSRVRAESVATYLIEKLGLAATDVEIEAKGSSEPVGNNRNAAGQALNRRTEIELLYRRVAQTVTTRVVTIAQVQMAPTVHVGTGRMWLTEDLLAHRPQLDVLALDDVAVDENGKMKRPVRFAGYSNYAAWIDEYTLQVYKASDTDLVRPLATLTADRLEHDKAFAFFDEGLTLKPGQGLAYVLEATDEDGRQDVTRPRLVGVVGASRLGQSREAEEIWGQSNLARQSIDVRGSRVRVHGEGFVPGERLRVDGQQTPVDGSGRFVAELHLSRGTKQIVVSGVSDGRTWSETLTADVDENYTFIVGLANITIGRTTVSDSFEELGEDDAFDESVHVDGRLAFYLKAKVRGRYLVTAQLDTTEDELGNLSDNLKRKDPRRVFRQLDPDKYYPVYGDDSTTVSDVYTQGPFFLRVDWDRNQLLLGNFETGLTDTEYMQYNRTLYGARFGYRSGGDTRFGDVRRSFTAFASEAQSAAAHVTFRGTGGSLYYLKHTDIVEGSEKVAVEIRQRDTGQVLERQDFIEGRDYEIDALQGRIILSSPLSQVVRSRAPSIVRTRPLEGDDVFLLVDYEYVPEAFEGDEMTYGVRGKAWVGDHVAVGASKIVDQQQGRDFDLEGVDVTVKAGKGTYLSVEAARSESLQSSAAFDSVDGGLRFLSRSDNAAEPVTSGEAFAVEGRVNLAEFSDVVTGDVRAWWKERDAGFSAGRLGHRFDTVEKGVDVLLLAGENVSIQAGYAERHEGPLSASRVGRVQADVRAGKFTVGGELRHEDIRRNGLYGIEIPDGDALLAGVRVGYDLDAARTVYGSVQTGLDESGAYVDNDMVAVGIDTQLSETTSVTLEASDGDRGSALSGGIEYSPAGRFGLKLKSGIGSGALTQFSGNYQLAEGHELYGSYALDPDRTFGERNLLTLGQRRDMGNRFGIFTESQMGDDDRYAGASHTFGLDFKTTHDWILSGLITVADNEIMPASIKRQAFSFGASRQTPSQRFSSKLEYRNDDGAATKIDQYVAGTSYTHVVDENRRWLGRLNISMTDDRLLDTYDARFVEFDIGHAYRPVADDRWNTLFKYGYFQDLVSIGQDAVRPDQRVHVLSAEALYRVNESWELGGKLAVKEGRMRSFRDTGAWQDASLALAVVRARRHVAGEWDALAEYRLLHDRHGDNRRHGALLGVYRDLGDQFEVGVGYNFTDFSDDIRDARYDRHGWFIDLIGKL